MEDQILVANSLSGDLDAFNQLIGRYQAVAFSVAFRLLHHRELAVAVVHDSCLQAYRRLASAPIGNFQLWLLQIVVQVCREQRQPRPDLAAPKLEDTCHSAHTVAHPNHQAESGAQAGGVPLSRDTVAEAMALLPGEWREVLVLHDIHGFSYNEIAEICGVASTTIRMRLGAARRSLRCTLFARTNAEAVAAH